jgi:hypothetical protein
LEEETPIWGSPLLRFGCIGGLDRGGTLIRCRHDPMPAPPEAANPLGHLRDRAAAMPPTVRARPATPVVRRVDRTVLEATVLPPAVPAAAAGKTKSATNPVPPAAPVGARGPLGVVVQVVVTIAPVVARAADVRRASAAPAATASRAVSGEATPEVAIAARAAPLRAGGPVEAHPAATAMPRAADPTPGAGGSTTIGAARPGATTVTVVPAPVRVGSPDPRVAPVARRTPASVNAAPRARRGATWPAAVRPTSGTAVGPRRPGAPQVTRPARVPAARTTARAVPCPGTRPSARR